MLAWLETHGHWGYIYASLAVSAILLLADLLPPDAKADKTYVPITPPKGPYRRNSAVVSNTP